MIMEKKQIVAALRETLDQLNDKHAKLEITVKVWNAERRDIDKKIQKAEQEMLDLRVRAWREYRDCQQQLEMF